MSGTTTAVIVMNPRHTHLVDVVAAVDIRVILIVLNRVPGPNMPLILVAVRDIGVIDMIVAARVEVIECLTRRAARLIPVRCSHEPTINRDPMRHYVSEVDVPIVTMVEEGEGIGIASWLVVVVRMAGVEPVAVAAAKVGVGRRCKRDSPDNDHG